jgi:tetratricopeptide (TPR) repeat protein
VRAAVLVGSLLAVPAAASASDFWESVLDPGLPRYRAAVSSGRTHLLHGENGLALVDFERAVAAQPDRPEANRLRGDALARLERWDAAIDAWVRARTLDPLLAYDPSLGFEVGYAEARVGRVADALEEFRRLIAGTGPGQRYRSRSLSLTGDLLMALGPERLDEAIASYRAALVEGPSVFADWGLALALDRADRAADAAVVLERLHRTDGRMASLSDDDVLFVPAGDAHAYRGLGFEAFGDLDRAIVEWQAFLDAGGDAGPWADSARRHLEAVRARIARRAPQRP